MPWARLHDGANGDAKLLALTDAAWRLWGCGLIYCQANLTDGVIPSHAIHTFGVRVRNKGPLVKELLAALVPGKGPLWHEDPAGYRIHDYLDWNDSREQVLAARASANDRLQRFRDRLRNGKPNGVRNGVARAVQTGDATRGVRLSTPTTTVLHPAGEAHTLARASRFARFWAAFPRKRGRHSAESVFAVLDPDDALVEHLVAALEAECGTDQWRRGVIPNAATWLRERRWEDALAHGEPIRPVETFSEMRQQLPSARPKGDA